MAVRASKLTLEGLAEDPRLIPERFHSLEYRNSDQEPEEFCDFVQDYAEKLDVEVEERRFLLRHPHSSVTSSLARMGLLLGLSSPALLTLTPASALGCLGITAGFYALVGEKVGACSEISGDRKKITVTLPRYTGPCSLLGDDANVLGNLRLHEYHNVYRALVEEELTREGLISGHGTIPLRQRETITPQIIHTAPTERKLKTYETKILNSLSAVRSGRSNLPSRGLKGLGALLR